MNNLNRNVDIPSPCKQAWNEMSKVDHTSRFCNSCQKAVHDLTKFSTPELTHFLSNQNQPVCARISSNQISSLNQPTKSNPSIRKRTVAALLAGLSFTGISSATSFAIQSDQTTVSLRPDSAETQKRVFTDTTKVKVPFLGRILDKCNDEPLPGAIVILTANSYRTTTDKNGAFSIPANELPDNTDSLIVRVRYIGYEDKLYTISGYTAEPVNIYLEQDAFIMGELIIYKSPSNKRPWFRIGRFFRK